MTSMRRKLLSFSCLAAAAPIFGPLPAMAQEGDAAATSPSDEIIVTGTRSSIINSLDEKRNEDAISDVLSADQAGRFPDNNIAEALARIPGVSFQRDNDSGDGAFISIRGLDATYNTVLNDGLRTGTADNFRRTPLDVVTGDGISSITITKAPLPEHASEGLGGVVDIRTRGALERSESFNLRGSGRHNSFDDRKGYSFGGSFTKHFSDRVGIYVSARYRKRFFDNLQIDGTSGLNLLNPLTFTEGATSVTVDDEDDTNDVLNLIPEEFIDISNFGLEGVFYDQSDIEEDNYSISGNIDIQLTDNTKITLGGRYVREDNNEVVSRLEFDADSDDFEDFDTVLNEFVGGPGPNTVLLRSFDDPEITFNAFLNDNVESQTNIFLRGETELENWDLYYIAGWSRGFRDQPGLELQYTNEYDGTPGGGDDNNRAFAPLITNGLFTNPLLRPGTADVIARAVSPFCLDGATPDVGSSCGEITNFEEELSDGQENERVSLRFDATRRFEGHDFLESIQFGGQYENSQFTDFKEILSFFDDNLALDGTYLPNVLGGADNNEPAGTYGALTGSGGVLTSPIRDFGALAGPGGLEAANFGLPPDAFGIPIFDGDVLRSLRTTHRDSFFASGDSLFNNVLTEATEQFFTGYFQARLNFDKLTVIGGVRLEEYKADLNGAIDLATEFALDSDELEIASVGAQTNEKVDNFEILPRIAFNYDFSDQLKLRAAFSTSISRPTFDLLTGVEGDFNITLFDGTNLATATIADVEDVDVDIEVGNPDLKNAYSYNFDLSAEYYFDRQNAISIAVFYKRINDFIYSSFSTPSGGSFANPGDIADLFASVGGSGSGVSLVEQLGGYNALIDLPVANGEANRAINGDQAEVYGLELGLFHTFSYLPGPLSNLGFIGNATFQQTSADVVLGVLDDDDLFVQLGLAASGDLATQELPFFNSPEIIGNIALFYEDQNWDATLGYRFAGVQLESVRNFGVNQWQQGRGFLDLDIDYTFRDVGGLDRVTIFFSASDLTDGGRKFSVFESYGREGTISDNSTFNGRTFTAGARIRF